MDKFLPVDEVLKLVPPVWIEVPLDGTTHVVLLVEVPDSFLDHNEVKNLDMTVYFFGPQHKGPCQLVGTEVVIRVLGPLVIPTKGA